MRQLTCCRAKGANCSGLCGYSPEVPFGTHFEGSETVHLCKKCFRSSRKDKESELIFGWNRGAYNLSRVVGFMVLEFTITKGL